jgi:hypothetical protein
VLGAPVESGFEFVNGRRFVAAIAAVAGSVVGLRRLVAARGKFGFGWNGEDAVDAPNLRRYDRFEYLWKIRVGENW